MSKLDSNESDGKGLFTIRNGKKVAKYEAGKWVPLLPGVAVSVTRHALRLKCRIKPLKRTFSIGAPQLGFYSAGTDLTLAISRKDCRKIWIEDVRNRPAIIAATKRSGHFVAVPQTAKAAAITATLPIASLREHNQTERTLASPSL